MPYVPLVIAAAPAFIASLVEFVEALTIILAVGNTRGWRAPIWGTVAAVATLAFIVLLVGTPLVLYREAVSQYFHLVIGTILLLFGMRWLRKAILRFAGIVALHDEELIYQEEVRQLRALGRTPERFDRIGFLISYKAMLVEGVEVAFIVIALGAQGPEALTASIAGAGAAFVLAMGAGAILRRPLSLVPENWMKFTVGVMLVTFGIYWGAEGWLIHWAFGTSTLLVILVGVALTSWLVVRMLVRLAPEGARVAARNV
ncbi:MAG: COG4280 domain-containing protein [Candidatus Limnocylindria bacterium]